MNKGSRWIILALLLVTILTGSSLFLAHSWQAHASGTPMLYPDNPYDNPYYHHLAVYDGVNFSAHALVTLTWSYAPIGTFTAGTIKTDAQGAFRFSILHMPSIPYMTVATLSAKDTNGLQATTSVRENLFVVAIPDYGSVGSTAVVKGGGYGSTEKVTVDFDQAMIIPVATATTDASGKFQATFTVPAGSTLGGSNLTIEVIGQTSGAVGNATFVVVPKVTLSPNQGPSGSAIVVKGHYFTPNSQAIIDWYDPTTKSTSYLGSVTVSATGTFQFPITAPSNLVPGVHYRVLGNDQSGNGSFAVFIAQA